MRFRILVADDDEFCRQSIARFLKVSGYDVETATNGTQAEALLRSSDFDFLIIDFHITGSSCQAIIKEMQQRGRQIPVCIITGDASAETERDARRLSPVFYCIKPAILDDVKAVVDRIAAQQARNHVRKVIV